MRSGKLAKDKKLEKFYLALNWFIKVSLFVAVIFSLVYGNWLNFFISMVSLFLIHLPILFSKKTTIVFPIELQTFLVLFVYTGLFLGEVRGFYSRFWWWDSIHHFAGGVVLCILGFLMIYIIYKLGFFKAHPFWVAFFSFCFALTVMVLWEIFEFGMDSFFGLNMQLARFDISDIMLYGSSRIAIYDTMWDLILGTLGAFFGAVGGYLFLTKGKFPLFSSLVKSFEKKNPHIFKRKK